MGLLRLRRRGGGGGGLRDLQLNDILGSRFSGDDLRHLSFSVRVLLLIHKKKAGRVGRVLLVLEKWKWVLNEQTGQVLFVYLG